MPDGPPVMAADPAQWRRTVAARGTRRDVPSARGESAGHAARQRASPSRSWRRWHSVWLRRRRPTPLTASQSSVPSTTTRPMAPAAYPAIFYGCHYATCSPGMTLPLPVSDPAVDDLSTHVSFDYVRRLHRRCHQTRPRPTVVVPDQHPGRVRALDRRCRPRGPRLVGAYRWRIGPGSDPTAVPVPAAARHRRRMRRHLPHRQRLARWVPGRGDRPQHGNRTARWLDGDVDVRRRTRMVQLWNATAGVDGDDLTVSNAAWNGGVAGLGTTTFGFGSGAGAAPSPRCAAG